MNEQEVKLIIEKQAVIQAKVDAYSKKIQEIKKGRTTISGMADDELRKDVNYTTLLQVYNIYFQELRSFNVKHKKYHKTMTKIRRANR